MKTVILSALLFFHASTVFSGPVLVKDADGNTLGYLLGVSNENSGAINFWIPQMEAAVSIGKSGVINTHSVFNFLFYKTPDCSDIPFTLNTSQDTSVINTLKTNECLTGYFRTAASQSEWFTPLSYKDPNCDDDPQQEPCPDPCKCVTWENSWGAPGYLKPLVSVGENLPFPVPLKLPLQFDFGEQDTATLQDAVKALQTVSGNRTN